MIFDKFDHLKVIFGFGHLIQEERKTGGLLYCCIGVGGRGVPKVNFKIVITRYYFFLKTRNAS